MKKVSTLLVVFLILSPSLLFPQVSSKPILNQLNKFEDIKKLNNDKIQKKYEESADNFDFNNNFFTILLKIINFLENKIQEGKETNIIHSLNFGNKYQLKKSIITPSSQVTDSIIPPFFTQEFDILTFGSILFLFLIAYIFLFNGAVCSLFTDQILNNYKLLVGVLESVLFGVLMSGVIDEIHIKIMGNRSIVTWIAEEIIFQFLPFLSIYEEGVKEVISSSFAVLLLGSYLIAYISSPTFAFIAGGVFSLSIPTIMTIIVYLIYSHVVNKDPSVAYI
ncbi:MAG: hypothetical protein KGY67_04845 [Candidatus Thermoplasmatota archaeon]|nr:hypothetical protein [Candidatus Thermoplasmatota archaeon]